MLSRLLLPRPASRRARLALCCLSLLATLAPPLAAPGLAVEQSAPQPTTIPGPATTPAPQTVERLQVTGTDGEGLRVRSAPGLAASIVARLPEGALARPRPENPVERDGVRWIPVRVQEGHGWIASSYTKKVTIPARTVVRLAVDAPFKDRVLAIAHATRGRNYVWGGTDPSGFDCSGLVQWVFRQAGRKDMPRTVSEQMERGAPVPRSEISPGDLLIFQNTYTEGISHVGIVLAPDVFIHASDESEGVTISKLSEAYWQERFVRAVRYNGPPR